MATLPLANIADDATVEQALEAVLAMFLEERESPKFTLQDFASPNFKGRILSERAPIVRGHVNIMFYRPLPAVHIEYTLEVDKPLPARKPDSIQFRFFFGAKVGSTNEEYLKMLRARKEGSIVATTFLIGSEVFQTLAAAIREGGPRTERGRKLKRVGR